VRNNQVHAMICWWPNTKHNTAAAAAAPPKPHYSTVLRQKNMHMGSPSMQISEMEKKRLLLGIDSICKPHILPQLGILPAAVQEFSTCVLCACC
jgi:hypothetical protein